jgi:hypothetical protein
MNALRVIRSEKIVLHAGTWQRGKIPSSAFPLSHVKALRLGKAWHWCVQRVQDAEREYNVLVAFDPGKRQYWAWLGAVFGDDQAVVARVEFHATHDGWHCHWKTGDLVEAPRGAVKAPSPKELRHQCSGDPVSVSQADAFGIAHRLFNVKPALLGGLV